MMNYQDAVLGFWNIEKRALAVFEGKLISPTEIKADAGLAERYWKQQLEGYHLNWTLRTMQRW